MRSSPLRNILWAGATVLALLLTLAAPAQATHSGDANSGTPDNADHHIDRYNLGSDAITATNHGIDELDRSEMNATLSGSGDVQVYDHYYGTSGTWSGVAGRVTCIDDDWWWTGDCAEYDLGYNLSYAASYSAGRWRGLACHEFGHTAGLGHRTSANDGNNNSCMRSTVSSARENFDSHDIDAIDNVL